MKPYLLKHILLYSVFFFCGLLFVGCSRLSKQVEVTGIDQIYDVLDGHILIDYFSRLKKTGRRDFSRTIDLDITYPNFSRVLTEISEPSGTEISGELTNDSLSLAGKVELSHTFPDDNLLYSEINFEGTLVYKEYNVDYSLLLNAFYDITTSETYIYIVESDFVSDVEQDDFHLLMMLLRTQQHKWIRFEKLSFLSFLDISWLPTLLSSPATTSHIVPDVNNDAWFLVYTSDLIDLEGLLGDDADTLDGFLIKDGIRFGLEKKRGERGHELTIGSDNSDAPQFEGYFHSGHKKDYFSKITGKLTSLHGFSGDIVTQLFVKKSGIDVKPFPELFVENTDIFPDLSALTEPVVTSTIE